MSSSTKYEEALQKLKLRLSNAEAMKKWLADPKLQLLNVPETMWRLGNLGISAAGLDALHAVHVTGTKGKGSTCAFVEIMLRSLGLKTGFFSSPVMIHDREMVRIDGAPLSEEKFADAVFSLHERWDKINPSDPDFACIYFLFMMVLAFDVFLQEKVDVAVIEVGLGGETDCTNVLRSPVACGFTTLDYDHVTLLGNTLESIAWNKSGIFKRNSVVVVSDDQPPEAMAKMRERANERKVASLSTAPPLSAYAFPGEGAPHIGLAGEHQKINLALALQLARAWLHAERPQLEKEIWTDEKTPWYPGSAFIVPPVWAEAIAHCQWLGRCQILERGSCRFFIDGAHTPKSVQSCADWFRKASSMSGVNDENWLPHGGMRETTLIFNCTGDRVPEALMESLTPLPFSRVLFCPHRLHAPSDASDSPDDHTKQAMICEAAWRKLRADMEASSVRRFDCLSEAMRDIEDCEASAVVCARGGAKASDVLVTGSLFLVGNVLTALGYKEPAN